MMTDEQFAQLEADAAAAWDAYQEMDKAMQPTKQKWHDLYRKAEKERMRRSLFAELKEEAKAQ